MKIIQVIPSLVLCGAEIMCENLTRELAARGHEVLLVSLFDGRTAIAERLERSGIEIRFLGKKRGIDLAMIGKLKALFRQEKPDVVHTHTHTVQYAAPAARAAGVPVMVHTVHNIASEEQVRLTRIAEGFFFRRWGLVPVALSARIRETIAEEYGIEREKIPVVYNGIDLSACRAKENYGTDGTFRILHIGRFSAQKNHEGLLRAFAAFTAEHPNAELRLVGDGALMEQTRALAEELGIGKAVHFLGKMDDVHGELHDADLFALPSNYEGMPMTIIEAMGSALPIVATAVGGVPDMLENGREAWLVANDTREIAEALADAAEHEEKRRAFGQAARERAVCFSAQEMALRYEEIYMDARKG